MSIFEVKKLKESTCYYLFGIRIFKKKKIFYELIKSFENNNHFNCSSFDIQTAKLVDKFCKSIRNTGKTTNDHRVAFLATELYDTGGHTEWLKNIIYAIYNLYEIRTFLTKYDKTLRFAPNKVHAIKRYSDFAGINENDDNKYGLIELFHQIEDYSPKVLFVFMHMNDFLANGVLYLLKKYTNIRIVYCNHGSHWPVLGGMFSDAFTTALPTTLYVDEKYRGICKGIKLNLCDSFKEDIVDISDIEKNNIRNELKIPEGAYFTLTGCTSYKLFSSEKSAYFEMIKHLLEAEQNLFHVVITSLSKTEKQIVDEIFRDSPVRKRLKIIPLTPDYSRFFQSCDLFIDSFPIGSALTHIELMKHKKVSVVKINSENALLSFHEYFPEDYPYMSDKVQEIEKFVIQLLHHPDEIRRISLILYRHYLNTFEASVVRNQLVEIIKNADHLEKLFVHSEPTVHYNLEIKR